MSYISRINNSARNSNFKAFCPSHCSIIRKQIYFVRRLKTCKMFRLTYNIYLSDCTLYCPEEFINKTNFDRGLSMQIATGKIGRWRKALTRIALWRKALRRKPLKFFLWRKPLTQFLACGEKTLTLCWGMWRKPSIF